MGVKGGGRRRGTPNARTEDLLAKIRRIGFDPFMEAVKLIKKPGNKMSDYEKATICLALAKFVYPTRKAIEAPAQAQTPTDVTYVAEWGSRHEPSDRNEEHERDDGSDE